MTRVVAHELVVDRVVGAHSAVRALDRVSLALEPGDAVAVMGASGAGKSTLGLALSGLLPLRHGVVQVLGGVAPNARRQAPVAMVLQRAESALFGETVGEDVGFVPWSRGMRGAQLAARVAWALEAVGLGPGFVARDPLALSGGEQRRVAIAGVLAGGPAVLVLDEPTAGLDARSRGQLVETLLALRQHGTTLVVITHDTRDAARLCERLVVLRSGTVAYDGQLGSVFADPAQCAGYGIEPPVAVRTAHAVASAAGVVAPATHDEHRLVSFIAETIGDRARQEDRTWVP